MVYEDKLKRDNKNYKIKRRNNGTFAVGKWKKTRKRKKKLNHIYNPKLQILCLTCIESELKMRTDIMMKNIQNQYDLSKEEYKIKVKIEIAEVSYNES